MIDETELRRLAQFQAETPILSVYLDVDPTRHTSEEYLLSLRNMLKQAEGQAAPEDIQAVQRYFEHEYDWSGRGWRSSPARRPISGAPTFCPCR